MTFETLEATGKLNIWVEPAVWNATKEGEEKPIKQLEVRTWSYQGQTHAKGWEAFRETDVNCTYPKTGGEGDFLRNAVG